MSKRTRIDASREARLWIQQVFIPAATLVVTAISIPEVRNTAKIKMEETKQFIQKKFNNRKN